MTKLLRVDSPTSQYFLPIAALFERTFPECERESVDEFRADLASGRGHALWAAVDETAQFLGFVRGCVFPNCQRAWIIHVALSEDVRGRGLGEEMFHLALAEFRTMCPGLEGIYLEVERVEDAQQDQEARQKRLEFFKKLGAWLVTPSYIQPPSQPRQPPVALNLLFWGETRASPHELVSDFYEAAFGYNEGHPFVRAALNGLS